MLHVPTTARRVGKCGSNSNQVSRMTFTVFFHTLMMFSMTQISTGQVRRHILPHKTTRNSNPILPIRQCPAQMIIRSQTPNLVSRPKRQIEKAIKNGNERSLGFSTNLRPNAQNEKPQNLLPGYPVDGSLLLLRPIVFFDPDLGECESLISFFLSALDVELDKSILYCPILYFTPAEIAISRGRSDGLELESQGSSWCPYATLSS